MTDTEALLKASIRDRRRLFLAFTVLLVLVAGSLGAGWMSAWAGRDAWHEQAMTWQDRYVELYDEFTVATGEEPSAPDPDTVANEGPQGEQGAPGPVGPAGPSGRNGDDGEAGAPGEPGAAGIPGTNGTAGNNGENGDAGQPGSPGAQGPPGETGAPGATGATGPAGPTCPDGFEPAMRWITVTDTEFGIPYPQQAIVCIPIATGGTTL